ncbi:hypothetical protein KY330_00915 [Candidatus Woesearchaeota archaeon]|nr:hypothetical protein [Candidatus Woesearchaeota archaeon]
MQLLTKIKKRFEFTKKEVFHLILSSLVVGFILGFNLEGNPTISEYLLNMLLSFIIVLFSLLIHITIMKIRGISIGHKVHYEFSKWSSLVTLYLVFLTNGFPLFSPGSFKTKLMTSYRIGKFPPGTNLEDLSNIGFSGSLTNIIIAFICKLFLTLTNLALFERFMFINILLAIYSFLPFPEFNGFYLLFWSRFAYIFYFVLLVLLGFLMFFMQSIIWTIITAIILAGTIWLIYYVQVERKL